MSKNTDNNILYIDFTKTIMSSFIDSGCVRRLFYDLTRTAPELWNIEGKEPIIREGYVFRDHLMQELGKRYESTVYELIKNYNHYPNWSEHPPHTALNSALMDIFYHNTEDSYLFAVECEYPVENNLVKLFFPPKEGGPEVRSTNIFRPDILIIEDLAHIKDTGIGHSDIYEQDVYELLPDGRVRRVTYDELLERRSIRIVDIKHILERKVGKKQFTEISLYMLDLSIFLKNNGLDGKFFVNISGNGIFPRYSSEELNPEYFSRFTVTEEEGVRDLSIYPPALFLDKCVIPDWHSLKSLLNTIMEITTDLWKRAPLNPDDIPLNIKKECAFCPYLDECIRRLKRGGSDPSNWSIRLVPYIKESECKLLENRNIRKIIDIIGLDDDKETLSVPYSYYPKIPMFKLRARALINNEEIEPDPGEVRVKMIPRYTPFKVSLVVESDPHIPRVFGICTYFTCDINVKNMKLGTSSHLYAIWMNEWRKCLGREDFDPEDLIGALKVELEYLFGTSVSEQIDWIFSEEGPLSPNYIRNYADYLKELEGLRIHYDNGDIYVLEDGVFVKAQSGGSGGSESTGREEEDFKEPYPYKIIYFYSDINKGLEDETEFFLLTGFLIKFNYIIETVIGFQQFALYGLKLIDDRVSPLPGLAVIYWSEEQLDNLKDAIERHLTSITSDPMLAGIFERILYWATPSESYVTHPLEHLKFYNLKTFVTTVSGLPEIIGYTWFSVLNFLRRRSGKDEFEFNKYYWLDYHDFMDFVPWHNYIKSLMGNNTEKAEKHGTAILRQLRRKAAAILYIFNDMRNKYIPHISKFAYPPDEVNFEKTVNTFEDLNIIAKNWYIFAKLKGTLAEHEAEFFRKIYPDFSIGKLRAAEVSDFGLDSISRRPRFPGSRSYVYTYRFTLRGLSSNIKVTEKDRVFLIPESARDTFNGAWNHNWLVKIVKMEWDPTINGYRVTAENSSKNIIEYLTSYEGSEKWYIFPAAIDIWSGRLYNTNPKRYSILKMRNIGISPLGDYLGWLWGIVSGKNPFGGVLDDTIYTADIAEFYVYSPGSINRAYLPVNVERKLFTDITPVPDESQKDAIINSMAHIISAIQGPPGTGKSQTVTALIDEFIIRKKKEQSERPIGILVTAFSYAALNVLIDKIASARNKDGTLAECARAHLIYVHSAEKDDIDPNRYGSEIILDNLTKDGGKWLWNGKPGKVSAVRNPLKERLGDIYIIFANPHQLYSLYGLLGKDFSGFDLIVIDEASQMPPDQMLAALIYVKKRKVGYRFDVRANFKELDRPEDERLISNVLIIEDPDFESDGFEPTRIVLVGDYNQLPPVHTVEPPKRLEKILDSAFAYYIKSLGIPYVQLRTNYRSNREIVEFTSALGIYEKLKAHERNAGLKLSYKVSDPNDPYDFILDPDKIVMTIIHNKEFEMSISQFEAMLTANLVLRYFKANAPRTASEERLFWRKKVGVVAPHNAQGRLIIRYLHSMIENENLGILDSDELMKELSTTVYSVERFQGSDRDLIIASIAISDKDHLTSEETFIYDLNRFNVLTSRAKCKIILICSRNFLEYIPKNKECLASASKIKFYALEFCNRSRTVEVEEVSEDPELRIPIKRKTEIEIRWHY